jgi:hypothetical protein
MPKDHEPLFVSLLVGLIEPPTEFSDQFRLEAKMVWRDLLTLGFCYHPGSKNWCWGRFVQDQDGDSPRINDWVFTEDEARSFPGLVMTDPGEAQ